MLGYNFIVLPLYNNEVVYLYVFPITQLTAGPITSICLFTPDFISTFQTIKKMIVIKRCCHHDTTCNTIGLKGNTWFIKKKC